MADITANINGGTIKATIVSGGTVQATVVENVVRATIQDQGPQGVQGIQGIQGETGEGVPSGGTTDQVLRKASDTNYDFEFHTLVKADVGLGNVDNTSDVNKPISSATQTALDSKSPTSHDHDGDYEPADSDIQNHLSSTSNPHSVTKSQVGLSNVDNTSDANKPVSTATQTALNLKSNTSHNHALAAGATDVTASAAEVNILDGATLSTAELNYMDGVTSNVQTQLNGKSSTGHNHTGTYQPLDADLTAIAGLGDPGADRILFWDDSAGAFVYLEVGANLTITDTTLDASGGGGGGISEEQVIAYALSL